MIMARATSARHHVGRITALNPTWFMASIPSCRRGGIYYVGPWARGLKAMREVSPLKTSFINAPKISG
jgi:hypothetical protein